MWYFSWIVGYGMFDSGHTKNLCDGTFGLIKRRFMATEVRSPKCMMACIDAMAENICCILSTKGVWYIWKELFKTTFKKLSDFHIPHFYNFSFQAKTKERKSCSGKK